MSLKPKQIAQLIERGQNSQAAQALQKRLRQHPQEAFSWQWLGLTQLRLAQFDAAVQALSRAAELNPQEAQIWAWLGVAHIQLKRPAQALEPFARAVALAPDNAGLWGDRARAQNLAQRWADSLESAERALALNSAQPGVRMLRGVALAHLGRLSEAEADLQQVLRQNPSDGEAWAGLTLTLMLERQYEAAVHCVQQGLQMQPDAAELWQARGEAELNLLRYADARASYQRACELDPQEPGSWCGLALVLEKEKDFPAAIAHMEKAWELEQQAAPDAAEDAEGAGQPAMLLQLGSLLQKHAQWDRLASLWPQLHQQLPHTPSFNHVFPLLSLPGITGREVLVAARAAARKERARLNIPATSQPESPPASDRPLRIGYLSGDFRDHPVSFLMAGVLEAHERSAFRVIGLDVGGVDNHARVIGDQPMRERVLAALDEHHDLASMGHEALARRIRELNLDVLIDLMGATSQIRLPALMYRPAPVQITWLGFPGTSGMNEMDYILADRHVAPPGSEDEFAEALLRLPETFQPNDDQRRISENTPSRASLGLPEQGFVFCCHNNDYKILPAMFDIWMRLLAQVPGSVLWLVQESELGKDSLRQQASQRGIAPARLVFAPRCGYADYLARYRLADLFLDTLPFNAGTTASDALWAGLPVLTQTGESFAGRMATSLLHAVGLPELITTSAAEYEALALHLATHPAELAELRQRLQTSGRSSPLFDTARFTRHLEQALRMVIQRQRQGLPPAAIDVPPLPAA